MGGSAAHDDSSEVSASEQLDDEVFGGFLAVLGNRGRPARAAVIAEISEKFRPPPRLYPVDNLTDELTGETTGDVVAGAAAEDGVAHLVERSVPVVPALFAEVGFGWVAGLRERDLAGLPTLSRGRAHVDPSRLALQVHHRLRPFYRAGLGTASPAWWGAVRRRRQLTVLLAPVGAITRGDGGLSLGNAVHGGCVLGGTVAVTVGTLPTPTDITSVFGGTGFRSDPPRGALRGHV